MPICRECGKMQASVEMRRSPKQDGGWLCKETEACKQRRVAKRANEIANRGGKR